MSFSAEIKQELSKVNTLANKTNLKIELLGYLITTNVSVIKTKGKTKIRFSTESEYNINRFGKLLSNLEVKDYKIELQGKNYVITSQKLPLEEISINEKEHICIENEKLKLNALEEKALVRGSFLGGGSINNPENNYHIEIVFREKQNAENIVRILAKYYIDFKILEKQNAVSIYSKDGEEISKFLAFIGANKSVLKFEDIRVYRDMRNNVNRIVNCETANLTKTVNAAIQQIEAIQLIKEKGKFSELTENLQEIAQLRIENPEVSLVELGKMLKEPIGKSGANYRLKAIIKFAEELRG